ncbi:hypothetical protein [Nonomuraea salmonea]|uniref:Uncharacterized protein n=1 Tax=Nonomuraea salmonea TaxID=46181 RepID=A0ABV5P2T7_9ACTN
MTANLTNQQKHALAQLLFIKAGDLVEFWSEATAGRPELHDVTPGQAAAQLTRWFRAVPGDDWDTRLDQRDT